VAAIVAVTGGVATATEAGYACSGGTHLEAQFSPPGEQPGQVVLTFADGAKPVTLPQAMSADGGRYVGDDIEFWIKGNDATLIRAGTTETCHTR
jgi:membrane-bound inhibitor of C-type lysozyme